VALRKKWLGFPANSLSRHARLTCRLSRSRVPSHYYLARSITSPSRSRAVLSDLPFLRYSSRTRRRRPVKRYRIDTPASGPLLYSAALVDGRGPPTCADSRNGSAYESEPTGFLPKLPRGSAAACRPGRVPTRPAARVPYGGGVEVKTFAPCPVLLPPRRSLPQVASGASGRVSHGVGWSSPSRPVGSRRARQSLGEAEARRTTR